MGSASKLSVLQTYFSTLEDQLGGEFHQKFGENVMHLNNNVVVGSIKGVKIGKSKFFFEFDLEVKENLTISIPPENYNAINFLYCQKGNMQQTFGDSNSYNNINEFQTAIVAHKTKKTIINLKANSNIRFVLISVCNQPNIMPATMTEKVHSLFANKMVNDQFTYFGSINLKISEQINSLNKIDEKGIVRKLMLDGTVQLILGMEIQHHKEDVENKTAYSSSLTRKELVAVQEIGERIKQNVAEPYSINMLMDETGISAVKLQEGFKLLYNRTVTDYIKNLRVEESERLISTTDLNISQIVYTIGFSSRSYFSKIFRQKYECSPNEYLNKCRVAVNA